MMYHQSVYIEITKPLLKVEILILRVKFLLIYLPIILTTWKSKHKIEIYILFRVLTITYASYIYISISF